MKGWTGIAVAFAMMAGAGPARAAPAPEGGTISIEAAGIGAGDPAAPVYAAAIGEALAAKGFTVLAGPGHAAHVAEVSVVSADVGTGSAKARSEDGAFVPGASGGVGAGVAVPLPSNRARSVPLRRIRLQLAIRKRGAAAVLWRGEAVTVRAIDSADADARIATSLGEAVLRGYPAVPPGVVTVP